MSETYGRIRRHLREVASLHATAGLLGWDQETTMPPGAGEFRAEQLGLLGRLAHERAADPRLGDWLAACEADPELASQEESAANLREIRRDYDRLRRIPASLVQEIGETASRALEAWKQARRTSNFAVFRPWLERQLALARRKAECLGATRGDELYDALLEDYEPGMTAERLERIFGPLRSELTRLLGRLEGARRSPDPAPAATRVAIADQRRLSRWLVAAVGFDLERGRLDESTHPFSSGLAPGDTRLTSRFRDDAALDGLGSTLHETGHGLYEQGLPKAERFGEPLAEPASLGIHESQSRLWENHVGRSREFWNWLHPRLAEHGGTALAAHSADALHGAVNRVAPHLIRVESDETTYNLHVMLRFDLERALLRGDLVVADLPAAWNERVREDLGLGVPDDARGCLQDIHWAMGSIGYFPTYTLGNLYAAQLWEAALEALPDLPRQIARGEFAALLGWLRREVHRHGRRYPATDLCERITEKTIGPEALVRHLEGKLSDVYGC